MYESYHITGFYRNGYWVNMRPHPLPVKIYWVNML